MHALVDHDQFYMALALWVAQYHGTRDEVPIGCVIVAEGRILAMAGNRVVQDNHPLYHAEWLALEQAFLRTGQLRIAGATLYTTLEPCVMCAGAIVLARVDRVVIGAMDEKRGCGGSVHQLLQEPRFNHRVLRIDRKEEKASSAMLTGFFQRLRKQKKEKKAKLGTKEP